MDRFKQISNNEEAVSGSGGGNSSNERTSAKRKRGDAMDIDEDEVNNDTVKQMLDEINREYQFPRLLSSRKLLELEVKEKRNTCFYYLYKIREMGLEGYLIIIIIYLFCDRLKIPDLDVTLLFNS